MRNDCKFPHTLTKEEFDTIRLRNKWTNIRKIGISKGMTIKQDLVWRNANPSSYTDNEGKWHVVTISFPDEITDEEKFLIQCGTTKPKSLN